MHANGFLAVGLPRGKAGLQAQVIDALRTLRIEAMRKPDDHPHVIDARERYESLRDHFDAKYPSADVE